MGIKYIGKRCNKCGGIRTEIIDDRIEEPKTFHKDLPKPCKCEGE